MDSNTLNKTKEKDQNDLSNLNNLKSYEKKASHQKTYRSIKIKLGILLFFALLLFAALAAFKCKQIFKDGTIEQNKAYATGIAELVVKEIPADKVETFLNEGKSNLEYLRVEAELIKIKSNFKNIKYLYIYQIKPDGCHVVFDLESVEGDPPSNPGDVIEFDEAFAKYIPTLLEGGEIDPIISNEKYGWLLTVYKPIYSKKTVGDKEIIKCHGYVGIDVSMNWIKDLSENYFKELSFYFLLLFIIILSIGVLFTNYKIIKPLNMMADATSSQKFSRYLKNDIKEGFDTINNLKINTGDEIEKLYDSFVLMTKNLMNYVDDIQHKKETISKMQSALIITLADMVESRDENTGQHIKNTARYVEIIMLEMRRLNIYRDKLTDEFIKDVVNSAPLHDIGKINVPDAILNKPGKLTDEEFDLMKTHTVVGGQIIQHIIETLPDPDYLYEAKNLATYHHEKWNGKGYPKGLAGEAIPLSARIMAIADVFDALVSPRSYKKGFPFEKAFAIIREESGTHFDPNIVKAFFSAQDLVVEVASNKTGKSFLL